MELIYSSIIFHFETLYIYVIQKSNTLCCILSGSDKSVIDEVILRPNLSFMLDVLYRPQYFSSETNTFPLVARSAAVTRVSHPVRGAN